VSNRTDTERLDWLWLHARSRMQIIAGREVIWTSDDKADLRTAIDAAMDKETP
jgi:hypothetical protein